MSWRGRVRAWVLALGLPLLLGLQGCGEAGPGPAIQALLPARGAPGQPVDVVGERFAGAARGVAFGGSLAQALEWQERRARVLVPALPAGHTTVVVTVDGRPSNAASFYVEGSVRLDAR
jgi:hypothetical protein